MKKVYDFYGDAGHGWLKVSRSEIIKLGIADKISSYSYQRNDSVYLEEDMDLSTFIKAKGFMITFREHVCNRYSKIRGYARYRQMVAS